MILLVIISSNSNSTNSIVIKLPILRWLSLLAAAGDVRGGAHENSETIYRWFLCRTTARLAKSLVKLLLLEIAQDEGDKPETQPLEDLGRDKLRDKTIHTTDINKQHDKDSNNNEQAMLEKGAAPDPASAFAQVRPARVGAAAEGLHAAPRARAAEGSGPILIQFKQFR